MLLAPCTTQSDEKQTNSCLFPGDIKTLNATVEERLLIRPLDSYPLGVDLARFPVDKWLLSSAVQKLIRRGRPEQAVKMALALHVLDPEYLPRRLPIIAFEDIGLGDVTACFDVLHVFGKQRFPDEKPEKERRRLLTNLVSRLARSVKSRTGCDVLCLASSDQGYSKAAAKFATSSEQCLIAMASDRGAPLTSRALALHLLSGMNIHEGRWPRPLSRFNGKALGAVAQALNLPEVIAWLMIQGRHTVGLAAMLPLVWELIAQRTDLRVDESKLQREKPILGVPAYAADMYTRIGKAAIVEFSRVLCQRHPGFFKCVPNARIHARLVGMAIFHAEGSKLDRWLENRTMADCRQQVEETELQCLGLPDVELQHSLYELIQVERSLLWKMRQSHLQAAFGEHPARNG